MADSMGDAQSGAPSTRTLVIRPVTGRITVVRVVLAPLWASPVESTTSSALRPVAALGENLA